MVKASSRSPARAGKKVSPVQPEPVLNRLIWSILQLLSWLALAGGLYIIFEPVGSDTGLVFTTALKDSAGLLIASALFQLASASCGCRK